MIPPDTSDTQAGEFGLRIVLKLDRPTRPNHAVDPRDRHAELRVVAYFPPEKICRQSEGFVVFALDVADALLTAVQSLGDASC